MLEDINKDLKTAMLAGDKEQVMVLRALLTSIQYAEIAKKASLDDSDLINLMQKEVKKRLEAAEMFKQGGANDREQKELREKGIIEKYLPEQLNQTELESIIENVITQQGVSEVSDMGKVIAQVRSDTAGRADGATIARLTKEKLSKTA